jgi:hypothetical protein
MPPPTPVVTPQPTSPSPTPPSPTPPLLPTVGDSGEGNVDADGIVSAADGADTLSAAARAESIVGTVFISLITAVLATARLF